MTLIDAETGSRGNAVTPDSQLGLVLKHFPLFLLLPCESHGLTIAETPLRYAAVGEETPR
jgi:hypothetical protein